MPLTFEPSLLENRLSAVSVTLQDVNVSQKSILRASIKELYSSDFKIVHDHRLLNWKRCLRDRKRQHDIIERSTRRKPLELCMNAAEDQRYLVEQKQILEFCRSSRPVQLVKLFDPDDRSAALCYGQPTLADRCMITPMNHIGVSTFIRGEKDLLGQGDRKTPKEKWLENPYLSTKMEELEDRFHEVNPCEPDMEELVVVGNNMMKSVQLATLVAPVISVYHENEFKETDDSTSSVSSSQAISSITNFDEDGRACLKINQRVLTWSQSTQQSRECFGLMLTDTSSTIDFMVDVHKLTFRAVPKQKIKEVIRFENIGNVKIRFSWFRKPDMDALPSSESNRTSKFFFNKNSGVFLPGQIYHFPFWFETQRVGIFEEYWTLETEPHMVKEGVSKTYVQLYADASVTPEGSPENEKLGDISLFLKRRVTESYAASVVAEIVESRPPLVPTAIYDFLLHRDEAFKDIGIDELHFGSELVDRVKNTFSERALDRLRAQHRVTPKELKKHHYVHGLLSEMVEKMERNAEWMRKVFNVAAIVGNEDDLADSPSHVASTRELLSILKNEHRVRESLVHIAFKETPDEISYDDESADAEKKKITNQAYHESLVSQMYFDMCNTVEDITLAIEELDSPRSAKLFDRPPVDRIEVPPLLPFVPNPETVEQADKRLPRLGEIYDFVGQKTVKKKATACKTLGEMTVIDYSVDQVPVEEMLPAKGKGGQDGKKKGEKDKGGSGKKSKK